MEESAKKEGILILDTNVFIKQINVGAKYENIIFYTTNEVIKEIRDQKTRDWMQILPFNLLKKDPDVDSIKFVSNFAKETGDYTSLSKVDLRLIALAHTLIKERNEIDIINTNPMTFNDLFSGKKMKLIDDEDKMEELKIDKLEKAVDVPKTEIIQPKPEDDFMMVTRGENKRNKNKRKSSEKVEDKGINIEIDPKEFQSRLGEIMRESGETENKVEEDSISNDGEGDWINPDNIAHKLEGGDWGIGEWGKLSVGIMTADYSMQNVILQMGITLYSMDALHLTTLKRFGFRCRACKEISKDETVGNFCTKCGNHMMDKVEININENGELIYSNCRKKNNLRGTQFTLPKPKTGTKQEDIILRQDQLLTGKRQIALRQQEKEKMGRVPLNEGGIVENYIKNNNIGMREKRFTQNIKNPVNISYGLGKKNPNIAKKYYGKKDRK